MIASAKYGERPGRPIGSVSTARPKPASTRHKAPFSAPMPALTATPAPHASHARLLGLGFLYWLAFLLVLEPGNMQRAVAPLDPLQEILRMGGAALLGALATPPLAALVRRFPPVTPVGLAIATFGALTASLVLIAASCLLAPILLDKRFPPFWEDFTANLAGNGLLLLFPIAGLMALAHVTAPRPQAAERDPRIAIRTRGRATFIAPDEIDWVEAQGNYAALHVGGRTHLMRETIGALQAQLGAARFVRINRSAIVPLGRIRAITPLANGDGEIELLDGSRLRLSRRYRAAVWASFEAT